MKHHVQTLSASLLATTLALGTPLLLSAPRSVQAAYGTRPHRSRAVAIAPGAVLEGVRGLTAPRCLPGAIIAVGENATVLVTGRAGGGARLPLFVAATGGSGRILVGGHEGFFSTEALSGNPDNTRFLTNAARWLSSDRKRALVVARGSGIPAALRDAGFTVREGGEGRFNSAALSQTDLLVLDQDSLRGDAAGIAAVQKWVQGGGGLMIAGPAWGWKQMNPERSLTSDHSGNRLLAPFGIAFTEDTLDPTGPGGAFLATDTGSDPALLTANGAVAALTHAGTEGATDEKLSKAALLQVSQTLTAAMASLPTSGDGPGPAFVRHLNELIAQDTGGHYPTKQTPVTEEMPFARLKVVMETRQMAHTPVDQIKAHPSAADFPGAVPADAPRLAAQTLAVDTTVPEWHSTGLYAAPGEVITVTVPASAANKGLSIRIGAHKDAIYVRPAWWRYPEITRQEPLKKTTLRLANPFGGPIYVVAPENSTLGTVPVTISGGVRAPYFVKGKTTEEEWKTLKAAPGPWAELQGDRVILTVPSYAVRDLDDPQALMTYWDQVLDAAADLYAIPHERKRQERYCVDVQISAGYMHSGYPIMTFDDVAHRFTDLKELRGPDGNKTWGFYHEMGHNHQQPDWTWDGCGEVTNNLFSLYGDEVFNDAYAGGDYFHAHSAIAPPSRAKMLAKYVAEGAPYEEWKKDPFLALTLFIQLRREFGWEPFKKVFGEYRTLNASERPRTDTDKHDQFMVRFSRVVGKNLGPFFTAWGLPTSEGARKSIADLPTWMPADWPKAVATR